MLVFVPQAVRVATGDLTAVTAASVRTEPCVTLSLGPVSARTVTRAGDVRTPVSLAIMAKVASCSANVLTVPPVTMRQAGASVPLGIWVLCK